MTQKIVLLDRDGTIIVDPPDERVTSEEEIRLFPDSISALKKLADNGFAVIIITNQAGIAEGRITAEEFERINREVLKRLAPSGIKVLKTYVCPHAPDDGCECRKPKPTMILEAAKEYSFELDKTYMIGDHRSDVLAGQAAGTKGILVHTANLPQEAPEADFQADTLDIAVEYILAKSS